MFLAAADTRAADWLAAAMTPDDAGLLSIVPGGFEAYVRIFHPARRGGETVRWHEIAAARGRIAHPRMQLAALLGSLAASQQWAVPGVYDSSPLVGSLPEELVPVLVSVLGAHTTADTCWFGVWEGYAGLRDDVRAAPMFRIPMRHHHLMRGPLGALAESAGDGWQSANLWWPDDRTWCVANEIDFDSTYVGCSAACAGDLVARRELEAFEIDPTSGFDWLSDDRNPAPSRG